MGVHLTRGASTTSPNVASRGLPAEPHTCPSLRLHLSVQPMPVKSQGCPPWPCGECPPGSWAFSLLKTPVAEGLRAALNAGVGVVSKQTKVLLPGSPHLARSLKQRQSLTSRPARAPCGPGAEGSDFGPSPKQPLGSSQLPSRLLEPRSPPKVPSPSSTWQRARPFPSTRSGHRVSLLGCAGLWALTRMPGSRKVNTQSGM